jgi:methionine-rich copper-binding protein CopC
MKKKILTICCLLLSGMAISQTSLIPAGSSWKYKDNGSNQGTAWRASSFNDGSWAAGNAQLGYGDGDEATVVSYGTNASKKYTTTYFRKSISIASASALSNISLKVKRDDGVVVYINGTERYRNNMPTGSISYTTKASSDASDDGATWQTTTLANTVFANGTNVIAVEIHQRTVSSSDISFDLELTATSDVTAPTVSSFSPADNATGVLLTANLSMTFSENVQKGTGNILIKEGGVTTQTIDVTSSAVSVSGAVVTINPSNFSYSASVNVEIPSGVIKDLSNNNFAGITNATTWNFTSESAPPQDTIAPAISTLSPADNATNVSSTTNLVITFNENIQKGTGNILIKEGGVTTQTIDVTNSAVSISGAVLTINPADLTYSASANIEIPAGAIKDLAGNNHAGITSSTAWNFTVQAAPQGNQTYIAPGASWKYLDNGSNQGTSWYGTSFNDGSWASGNAQLGYGDGDEATVISYGANSSAKYITSYFRKSISITDPTNFTGFTLRVKRDDGIVVYVNGVERYRSNMPTGTISYTTLASSAASDDGATWFSTSLATSVFASGTNVIAVEMHQNAGSSSDLSFDLELIGNVAGAASITRGPYLQLATANSVIVRWRTDVATNSKVSYGSSPTNLTASATDNTSVTDHIVQLTGLSANTVYYYSFGSTALTLQGDADNFFKTAPVIGSTSKTRIWVVGDCGNNSTNQANVRNQYHNYIGSNMTDVWLLLGDNAYNGGLDNEYQSSFYDIYKNKMLKQAVLWPAPGNHDYNNSATLQNSHNMPYYDMFSLPTSAQAGGVASGTEAYYSYTYGNVHFLSLDSYGKESSTYRLYDTLGPQAVWVKQDLAADTSKWKIAYWHHPPYTMGSHNSDSESELVAMRQNFIKILERYKVDLILCGHSHDYERSKLMKGHYGNEASFNASTHHLSSSSAKYDGSSNSCPYHKNAANGYNGTVYVVSGSAGQLGGTQASFPHNAMYYSDATNGGSMAIDVEENRLDAKWICADGTIRDKFTMVKDVSKTVNISITSSQSAVLTASWVGNYSWNSASATSRSITVSPDSDSTYIVTDGLNCTTDTFKVHIVLQKRSNVKTSSVAASAAKDAENLAMKIYPNPFSDHTTIEYSTPFVGEVNLEIYDLKGSLLKTLVSNTMDNGSYKYELNASENNLTAGIYLVKLRFGENQIFQKLSVSSNK